MHKKYGGNKYVKHFTCWNQLLCMIFGQLTNRDSLRDLIVAINVHNTKCYHLGFGKSVTLSNLPDRSDYKYVLMRVQISIMSKLDIFILISILLGIYIAFNIKKDYLEYRKNKMYWDLKILVRDIGVLFAVVMLIAYKIILWFYD
jgi:hypothetical protein